MMENFSVIFNKNVQ